MFCHIFLHEFPYICDMKVLTTEQIRELDAYTIENEPISSLDLMERVARTITRAIAERWPSATPVKVFCGPGNNGGDGLAVSRLLGEQGYDVETFLFNTNDHLSQDCSTNAIRLKEGISGVTFHEITQDFTPPVLTEHTLVIDSLFGTGLNKPLTSGFASLVKYINASPAEVVSIDIPSGLMSEDNTYNIKEHIIRANLTLTLQLPKLSFFFKETQDFLGKTETLDIHLSAEGLKNITERYAVTEEDDMKSILLPRDRYSHKGMMGHGLLIAGSKGMAGASLLAARACLRSGIGKLTIHAPAVNNEILQLGVPEAIISEDANNDIFSQAVVPEEYNAVAIGPGLGQAPATEQAFIEQISNSRSLPLVLDADALNILAVKKSWLEQIPKNSILTPHPKELDRLLGRSENSYQRLSKARERAMHSQLYIIIKGCNTAIVTPTGYVYFNPTGNPGMATAGSGDVLTGILLGLLARGYTPENACRLGVYLHGLAGDIAAKDLGEESLLAGDIVNYLPKAFKQLQNK